MFDFIENAVRSALNDLEYQMTERSFKKAEKEYDAWAEQYQKRVEQINAIDPDSNAARQWCVDNHDLTTEIEDRIKEIVPEDELKWGTGYYRKAYTGMQCALAALRSISLSDEEGFVVWPKDMRTAETSIRFFFGKAKYKNYDDISDSEVPPLKDLMSFENSCDCWICNETIEEAFLRVQGDTPLYKLEINIEENQFAIKRMEDVT